MPESPKSISRDDRTPVAILPSGSSTVKKEVSEGDTSSSSLVAHNEQVESKRCLIRSKDDSGAGNSKSIKRKSDSKSTSVGEKVRNLFKNKFGATVSRSKSTEPSVLINNGESQKKVSEKTTPLRRKPTARPGPNVPTTSNVAKQLSASESKSSFTSGSTVTFVNSNTAAPAHSTAPSSRRTSNTVSNVAAAGNRRISEVSSSKFFSGSEYRLSAAISQSKGKRSVSHDTKEHIAGTSSRNFNHKNKALPLLGNLKEWKNGATNTSKDLVLTSVPPSPAPGITDSTATANNLHLDETRSQKSAKSWAGFETRDGSGDIVTKSAWRREPRRQDPAQLEDRKFTLS